MTFMTSPSGRFAVVVLLAALGVTAWSVLALAGPAREGLAGRLPLFVGTYTQGTASMGIYRLELDPVGTALTEPAAVGAADNPSFLALHPNHRFLYAVNEVGSFHGEKTGAVSAFAIDPDTGKLTRLNQQSSGGAGPCHLIIDRLGKHVLAANYGGGSVCVLPVGADGRLSKATCVIQHRGRGANPQRQEAPHAHSIHLDAANRFAVVCDLGLDQVFVYRFDAEKGTLTPNDPPSLVLPPGSGPRHFAFAPDGRHAYVINELNSTLTALDYDPERGVLKAVQTVRTLPEGFKGENSTAEVQVHPSGRFVYGSNRGHDSIAVFAADLKTGKLTSVEHQTAGIRTPRNFALDPSGAYLVVASQSGNRLSLFRIDPDTGRLHVTGRSAAVPAPVCVKFVPRP